jgi:redox-sensing transcriptional repressor
MQNFRFSDIGFKLDAAFDVSPALIGTEVAGVPVLDLAELERFASTQKPDVAVLTVPRSVAQSVADQLIVLGIRGFWNFTNVELSSAVEGVQFEDVHFSDSLLTLSYRIMER